MCVCVLGRKLTVTKATDCVYVNLTIYIYIYSQVGWDLNTETASLRMFKILNNLMVTLQTWRNRKYSKVHNEPGWYSMLEWHKMKRSFFQAAVTSILLYGGSIWTLTKRLEKKLDGNYTRMLRAILNKSWRQHPTRHQLYGHLPPIPKTLQVRWTGHAGHCWRSRDELIRDVLLWTPTYGRAKAGRPARTCIQQLCEDTGCCPEDLR